ncbi:hypothetical protein YC2023_072874 [Brassica napus]
MVAVDVNEKNSGSSLKFLCSYGGRILPRSTDGKLRYVGGHTRVLSVHRSISFEELMKKLFEFCGYSVDLRCQLPNGDLEISVVFKQRSISKISVRSYAFPAELAVVGVREICTVSVLSASHGSW